jgi:hypothetical protein
MASTGPWVVRATWVAVALGAAPALGDALDDASRAVQVTASVGLWAGWVAVLVAALVPRASSLTVLRAGAPAALVATVAAAVHGPTGTDDAIALGVAAAAVAASWWAVTADAFVDGSSYGDERRFALRSPPGLLLGAVPVAWGLAVVVPAVAALLLAARSWVPGGLLALAGAAGIRLGAPALHRLSRRWLVLVPAGLVVHDHLTLPDPVLLRRGTLRRLGPVPAAAAPAADDLDLRLGAGGLPVGIELVEPTELPLARGAGRRRAVETVVARRVVVAPVRPGAFLAAAAGRLPVGPTDLPETRPRA